MRLRRTKKSRQIYLSFQCCERMRSPGRSRRTGTGRWSRPTHSPSPGRWTWPPCQISGWESARCIRIWRSDLAGAGRRRTSPVFGLLTPSSSHSPLSKGAIWNVKTVTETSRQIRHEDITKSWFLRPPLIFDALNNFLSDSRKLEPKKREWETSILSSSCPWPMCWGLERERRKICI